jgi:hypothetical protein
MTFLEGIKKPAALSYIVAFIICIAAASFVRRLYVAYNPDYNVGGISAIGLSDAYITLIAIIIPYFLLQPFVNAIMLVPIKRALIKSIWELPLTTAIIFTFGGLPYMVLGIPFLIFTKGFLFVVIFAFFGFLLGLGIRKLYQMLVPSKDTPSSS